MGTTATLEYDVDPAGASVAALTAAIKAAPLPVDLITQYGLRLTSDATAGAAPIKRTLVFNFSPSVMAVGHTTTIPGDPDGSPVNQVFVDAAGLDFIVPPAVVIAPPPDGPQPPHTDTTLGPRGTQATATCDLTARLTVIDSPGVGYDPTTFAIVLGAMAPPRRSPKGEFSVPSCVQRLNLNAVGKGYSSTTKVQFQGGLGPGGVEAQADCVVAPNGRIKSVRLTNPGHGYINAPKVFFYDPTNRGNSALVSAAMGEGTPATLALTIMAGVITAVTIVTPGNGYLGVPSIVIIDPTNVGAGAVAHLRMGVGSVRLIRPGSGYGAPPALSFIERFKTIFPDGTDQRKPFWRLVERSIALTCVTPVTSIAPVVA